MAKYVVFFWLIAKFEVVLLRLLVLMLAGCMQLQSSGFQMGTTLMLLRNFILIHVHNYRISLRI